jgi:hypothetical protein
MLIPKPSCSSCSDETTGDEHQGPQIMRVLVSSVTGYGHLQPLVPLATAFSKAGHDVAIAIGAELQPRAEAAGFAAFDCGIGVGAAFERLIQRFPDQPYNRLEPAEILGWSPTRASRRHDPSAAPDCSSASSGRAPAGVDRAAAREAARVRDPRDKHQLRRVDVSKRDRRAM